MAEADDAEQVAAGGDDGGEKGGGLMGPVLALLVTLVIGIGLGMLFLKMIAPPPAEEDQTEEQEGQQVVTSGDEAELLDKTGAMVFEDVITNLRGQLSRYIKVKVQVWFEKEGEHFQTITTDERVKFMLQEQMIEVLRSFDPGNLDDPFVLTQMKKSFRDRMDRELRIHFGAKADQTFVEKVVISDFILQ